MDINEIIRESKRPLFLVAHQDDELGYAGLIQRIGEKGTYVFLTNGDGLAPYENMDPAKYAEIRKAEAVNALGVLGIPPDRISCLDFSEIEIYRQMWRIGDFPEEREACLSFFRGILDRVREVVANTKPDLVFTLGFQGGHPEHDLTHFFTAMALKEFNGGRKEKIPLFHLPEYELTILIPFRFGPWYKGERLRIQLTEQEIEKKREMMGAYPSQVKLFAKFEKVIRILGTLPKLIGKGFTPEDFLGTEQISPVPEDFDYTRAPYPMDFLNYMFEDFEKHAIGFEKNIRPITQALLQEVKA